MQFQLLSRIFLGLTEFLVFRIDVINSSLAFRVLSNFGSSTVQCCFLSAEISLTYLTNLLVIIQFHCSGSSRETIESSNAIVNKIITVTNRK